MIFLPIFILSLILYFQRKMVSSFVLFFFFLSNGFNLVPEDVLNIGLNIKLEDYTIAFLSVFFIIYILAKTKIDLNRLPRYSIPLLGFIFLSMLISCFIHGISFIDILKTGRPFLLLLSPLLFISVSKDEGNKIIKILFNITLIASAIYVMQVFFEIQLLNGYLGGGYSEFFGLKIPRCYNTPFFLTPFLFYAIFSNPYKGSKKWLSILLVHLPLLFSMHRSAIIAYVAVLIITIIIKGGLSIKTIRYLIISTIFSLPLLFFISDKMSSEQTSGDIFKILSGDFRSYEDVENNTDATLLFRFAHFFERFDYSSSRPLQLFTGIGWMHEDSEYVKRNLDFRIGLDSEYRDGDIAQIDTADIAWSLILVRLGIIGGVIYLLYFYRLIRISSKNQFSLVCFSGLLFLFFTSFTSTTFFAPYSIVIYLFIITTNTENYGS